MNMIALAVLTSVIQSAVRLLDRLRNWLQDPDRAPWDHSAWLYVDDILDAEECAE